MLTFDSVEHWAIMKTEHIEINKAVRQGDAILPKLSVLTLKDVFKRQD